MRSILLTILLACSAYGQQASQLTVLPSQGKSAAVVRATTSGRWFVLSSNLKAVESQAFKLTPEAGGGSVIFWEGDPGSHYTVLFVPDSTSEGLAAATVVLGTSSDVPTPPIDTPVVTPGADTAVVVENHDDRPKLTKEQLEVIMGDEVRGEATRSGLGFRIVRTDESGPDLSEVQSAITAVQGKSLPRLIILKEGKVVYNQPLPSKFETIKILKQYGKAQ